MSVGRARMIGSGDLGSGVVSLGELLGVLIPGDGGATINRAWFEDPIPSLKQIDTRLKDLVGIIEALLGPAVPAPPDVFHNAQWYAIPDPSNGDGTPFCIVASAAGDASGQIGLGILAPIV